MEDVKIGEYVRTYSSGIRRIDTVFENKTKNKYGYETNSDFWGTSYAIIKTTDIKKHSKNIIDLIEVGDILKIEQNNSIFFIGIEKDEGDPKIQYQEFIEEIKNRNIRLLKILTKEAFENNCYEVGD